MAQDERIRKFCSHKAYIYFLQVLAQLIAFLSCRDLDSNLVISFTDNSSGFFALRKGYCKDEAICSLIGLTWRVIAKLGWHLHLERVASAHNISDQVSRQNFDEMVSIAATADQLSMDEIYNFKILYKAANDTDYTFGPALDDLLRSPLHHSTPAHWSSG